jgi:glucose-6-phosphate 1-dehydrogenase
MYIDSWRWQGVPFFIRAGKCLPITATEVVVELKAPPQQVFDYIGDDHPNYFRFRLGPDRVAIAIGSRTKSPGDSMRGEEIELSVYNNHNDEMLAYERLLDDAMHGDGTLFSRRDGIEDAWRAVEPVLNTDKPVHEYDRGTWGPIIADPFLPLPGRWKNPK